MWTPARIDTIRSNIDLFQSHASFLLDAMRALSSARLWPSSDEYRLRKGIKFLPVSHHRKLVGAVRYTYHRWRLMHSDSMSSFIKALQHHSSATSPIAEKTISRIIHHETHTQGPGSSYRITQLEKGSSEYLQAITGMLERFITTVRESQTHPSQVRRLPLAEWAHDLQWFEEQLFQFEQDILSSEMDELEERQKKLIKQDYIDGKIADDCDSPTWRRWRLKKRVRTSMELRVERMRGIWWEKKVGNGRRSLIISKRSSEQRGRNGGRVVRGSS